METPPAWNIAPTCCYIVKKYVPNYLQLYRKLLYLQKRYVTMTTTTTTTTKELLPYVFYDGASGRYPIGNHKAVKP